MTLRKLTHEEIAAQRLSPDEAQGAERLPIYGMLDNIRSLYNVGSIFRTSDGAFIRKLFLCGYTPYPPRREIEKTALGATMTVPWEHHKSLEEGIAAIRKVGAKICVLEHTSASIPYYSISRDDFPLCIVVGNEITGISPELVAAADMAIEIPMYGTKQSLNAAVAYGIAVFELTRVWRQH